MYNVIKFLVIFVWCRPLVIYSIFCFLWHDIKGNISLCRKLFCVTGIICMKYYHLIENNFFCQNIISCDRYWFPVTEKKYPREVYSAGNNSCSSKWPTFDSWCYYKKMLEKIMWIIKMWVENFVLWNSHLIKWSVNCQLSI